MTTVRVQGPEGSQSLELPADATVGALKDAIADKLGIPTAAQTLLTGFPPSTLTADDSAALAATLGSAFAVQMNLLFNAYAHDEHRADADVRSFGCIGHDHREYDYRG